MTPRFGELLWRMAFRPALRHPGLWLLNTCGIALGVAVFLAVQVASRSALESFRASVDLAAGRAHLEVRGPLDETYLPRVASTKGVRAAAPLVEGIVPFEAPSGEYLRVVGIDPLAAPELFAFRLAGTAGAALDIEAWLREPGLVAVAPAQAARMRSWVPGGAVTVLAGAGRRLVRPAFEMVADEPLARAEPRLAAMDIGWAQEMLGKQGQLTSIQILLEDEGRAGEVADALRAFLPPDARVAPPAQRHEEMRAMLGAFRLNLTAMSLVSVVVGMFLVYNSASASVVRRQRQIAILRACGATRGEVRGLFLGEVAGEALVGCALGVLAAPLVAALLAPPVAGTISSLYALVRIESLSLTSWQIAAGFAVGLLAALGAAWIPAGEAANADPARILHAGAANTIFAPRLPRLAALAALALALAAAASWAALHGGPKLLGFASAALVLCGFTLLVPWFARVAAAVGRPCGVLGRLAADHLDRSLHRNAVTIAALAAAVSMAVAVSVMIHSFRSSVARWVERTLTADLYIAPAANELGGLHAFLPASAAEWAAAHPAVAEVSTFREAPVRWRDEPVALAVLGGSPRGSIEFLDGSSPDAGRQLASGRAVAVSESFRTRFGGAPEVVELALPRGVLRLPVVGVVRDYTREGGAIFVALEAVAGLLADRRQHSLAVRLRDKSMTGSFADDFQRQFGGAGLFAVYDQAALRARIFEIFEQTFSVTATLRGIAVLVAAIGVAFSLGILVHERTREVGILRAVGASRRQVLAVFLGEAGLIGLAAGLAGLAGGATLAMVLTWVVNKAFFGWSIALSYPAAPVVWALPALVAVAILAALVPAWRAARTNPAASVRFE